MRKYAVPGTILALVAGMILVRLAILNPARAAARNLAAINGISAGKTSEAELLARKEFQTMPKTCFQETCLYHAEAENVFLSRLRLAPRTYIGTAVAVRNGVVVDVSVMNMRTGLHAVAIRQLENLPKDCSANPCVKLPPANLPSNVTGSIRIILDNQSEARNHLPEAVNVQCLSQRHGCARYVEFVPLMREFPSVETPAGMKLQGQN
jgi:hypothetical protein